ncbi:hypothetical protein [Allomeiothermus silvanus]|uniref:hypothetical protein n=1 Tax=Allomeiothermus silvanus TaxID=52022 RepID=UPI0011D04ECE|nr:hypothetical protein [Allomeiothermus silvanus]
MVWRPRFRRRGSEGEAIPHGEGIAVRDLAYAGNLLPLGSPDTPPPRPGTGSQVERVSPGEWGCS